MYSDTFEPPATSFNYQTITQLYAWLRILPFDDDDVVEFWLKLPHIVNALIQLYQNLEGGTTGAGAADSTAYCCGSESLASNSQVHMHAQCLWREGLAPSIPVCNVEMASTILSASAMAWTVLHLVSITNINIIHTMADPQIFRRVRPKQVQDALRAFIIEWIEATSGVLLHIDRQLDLLPPNVVVEYTPAPVLNRDEIQKLQNSVLRLTHVLPCLWLISWRRDFCTLVKFTQTYQNALLMCMLITALALLLVKGWILPSSILIGLHIALTVALSTMRYFCSDIHNAVQIACIHHRLVECMLGGILKADTHSNRNDNPIMSTSSMIQSTFPNLIPSPLQHRMGTFGSPRVIPLDCERHDSSSESIGRITKSGALIFNVGCVDAPRLLRIDANALHAHIFLIGLRATSMTIAMWNYGAAQLTGFDQHMCLGSSMLVLLHESSHAIFSELFEAMNPSTVSASTTGTQPQAACNPSDAGHSIPSVTLNFLRCTNTFISVCTNIVPGHFLDGSFAGYFLVGTVPPAHALLSQEDLYASLAQTLITHHALRFPTMVLQQRFPNILKEELGIVTTPNLSFGSVGVKQWNKMSARSGAKEKAGGASNRSKEDSSTGVPDGARDSFASDYSTTCVRNSKEKKSYSTDQNTGNNVALGADRMKEPQKGDSVPTFYSSILSDLNAPIMTSRALKPQNGGVNAACSTAKTGNTLDLSDNRVPICFELPPTTSLNEIDPFTGLESQSLQSSRMRSESHSLTPPLSELMGSPTRWADQCAIHSVRCLSLLYPTLHRSLAATWSRFDIVSVPGIVAAATQVARDNMPYNHRVPLDVHVDYEHTPELMRWVESELVEVLSYILTSSLRAPKCRAVTLSVFRQVEKARDPLRLCTNQGSPMNASLFGLVRSHGNTADCVPFQGSSVPTLGAMGAERPPIAANAPTERDPLSAVPGRNATSSPSSISFLVFEVFEHSFGLATHAVQDLRRAGAFTLVENYTETSPSGASSRGAPNYSFGERSVDPSLSLTTKDVFCCGNSSELHECLEHLAEITRQVEYKGGDLTCRNIPGRGISILVRIPYLAAEGMDAVLSLDLQPQSDVGQAASSPVQVKETVFTSPNEEYDIFSGSPLVETKPAVRFDAPHLLNSSETGGAVGRIVPVPTLSTGLCKSPTGMNPSPVLTGGGCIGSATQSVNVRLDVVLLEHNLMYHISLTQMLWKSGHAVSVAFDFADLVHALEESRPNLVFVAYSCLPEDYETTLKSYLTDAQVVFCVIVNDDRGGPHSLPSSPVLHTTLESQGFWVAVRPLSPSLMHSLLAQATHTVVAERERQAHIAQIRTIFSQFNGCSWEKGVKLGSGAFGDVYRAKDLTTGGVMAVKAIALNPTDRNAEQRFTDLVNEVALLRTLEHENIIHYLYCERGEDCVYVFMEYANGGTVASALQRLGRGLPITKVVAYTRDLVRALVYLHEHNIMHRDIKCANLLLSDGKVKLGDFGTAYRLDPTQALPTEMKGTLRFMAPEVAKEEPHDTRADIWSLGCTVLEMLTGTMPLAHLDGSNYVQIIAALCRMENGDEVPIPENITSSAKSFLSRCLCVDPHLRPTARTLLSDPFLTNLGAIDRRKRLYSTVRSVRAMQRIHRQARKPRGGSDDGEASSSMYSPSSPREEISVTVAAPSFSSAVPSHFPTDAGSVHESDLGHTLSTHEGSSHFFVPKPNRITASGGIYEPTGLAYENTRNFSEAESWRRFSGWGGRMPSQDDGVRGSSQARTVHLAHPHPIASKQVEISPFSDVFREIEDEENQRHESVWHTFGGFE